MKSAADLNTGRPHKCHAVFWWRAFLLLAAAGFSLLIILQPPPWRVLAESANKTLSLAEIVYIGTWWGAACSMAVMAVLFAICPWWACAPTPKTHETSAGMTPRWFLPAVLAAVITGGAIAAPTLGHSLWDDEHETLVWYVLGRYVRQKPDGHVKLKEHNWRRTIFGYSTPNNHIFHNILARSTNSLWRAIAKPDGLQFSEVALRIPAFLAGMACIAALAFLLKDFGLPQAGAIAAWFLALQPWFTHHMALARGYTLTMLFAVLAVLFWRKALVSGAWQWWALLAACELLGLWTYPALLFLFAILNAALLLLITLQAPQIAGPRRTMTSRWFCCSAMAGAGLLPLVFPLISQIRDYIDSLTPGLMGLPWLANFFCFLAAGTAWNNDSTSNHNYEDLQQIALAYGPVIMWALLAFVAMLFLLGIIRFARGGPIAAVTAASLVLGPTAHWLYAEAKGIILWEWYLIYFLPFVGMFMGVGLWTLASAGSNLVHKRPIAPIIAVIALLLYAFATSPVRAWHLVHSKVPYRESSLAARADTKGNHAIVFSTTGAALAYDPQLFYIENPVDLAVLMFQADAQHRPLIANMGQMETLRSAFPKIYAMIENQTLFPQVKRFQGFFSGGDRFVCRYAPGSADTFDFSGILTPEEVSYARRNANILSEVYFTGGGARHAALGVGGYGPAPGVGKNPEDFRK